MEVLIAIIIFAIGMMALAQLQGTLTRSSANANVRTVATSIAEETIETLRGFARLTTDPAGLLPAYEDIVTAAAVTETRGGIAYSVTTTVSDWYYDIVSDTFMDAATYFALPYDPVDAFSDYKLVSVNVTWDDTRPWLIDDSQSFTADTGVTLSTVISSLTTGGSSVVVTQGVDNYFAPVIDYNPGQNPEIVSLSLGDNKFKESLTPEPKVYRLGELMETRFDVVTYSQTDGSALFVRREEFVTVSCECTLSAPPGDPESAGRRPTVWQGDEYNEALWVDKAYGTVSLSLSQQSPFCDVCCQDHHDGGSHADDPEAAATRYEPFTRSSRSYWDSGTFAGDHKHYYPDAYGTPVAVSTAGATYLEACALVRKDGFMRVAQDFNQVGVNAFPQDFLDESSEVSTYSSYVTGAVSDYLAAVSTGYESSPPALGAPAAGVLPNSTTLPLVLAESSSVSEQQLRNRGIYMAYINNDLQYVIDCLTSGGGADSCQSGDVKLDQTGSTNVLELLPFFDVQLTKLSRWNETPINNPVDTTNEALVTGNLHSRGLAFSGGRQGLSLVAARGHPGNIGLIDTGPIEPNFSVTTAEITVNSTIGDEAFDPSVVFVSGTITSSLGGVLSVSDVTITSADALCDRTPFGFTCAITGASPTITLAGYGKSTKTGVTDRIACSQGLVKLNQSFSDINPWAVFSLAGASQSILYDINITRGTCPSGGGIGF